MSSLDLRVLVLERQRLQLQKDLDVVEGIVTGGGLQPGDPTLSALAALVGTANTMPYFISTDVMDLTPLSPYSRTLLDDADAGTWRSTLGLGTMSTQNASAVGITGGSMMGMTEIGGSQYYCNSKPGDGQLHFYSTVTSAGGTGRYFIYHNADAPSYFGGALSFAAAAATTTRTNLGLGTMSTQNANAVAITGGSAISMAGLEARRFDTVNAAGDGVYGYVGNVNAAGGSGRFNMYIQGDAPCQLFCPLNVGNTASFSSYVGIAGAADTRWNFTNWGSSYFSGTSQFNGSVGMGYAPPSGINLRASSGQWDYLAIAGGIDTRFSIRSYGDIYCDAVPYKAAGGPWVTYSDERMKHGIAEIPHPLETLCALHGVLYEWNDNADGKPPGVHMGVIAQEVEEVLPEWVGELSGYKTTQLSRFEALTIEAVKALTARVAALEAG